MVVALNHVILNLFVNYPIRYVRNKVAKSLKECAENVELYEEKIKSLTDDVEKIRNSIATIEKTINESGTSVVNLRENLRLQKLRGTIVQTQQEIDSYDIEEASKAKRTFNEQWQVKKAQESNLHGKVC